MNRRNTLIVHGLAIAAIFLLSIMIVPRPASALPQYGPREDDLLINYYSDVEAAYTALKTGDIDMVMYDITKELYDDAITDPNIQLSSVDDMGMYEVDINNNWTIATYPGLRSPTSDRSFRQAMAWLLDKEYVRDTILAGFGARIDVPVAASVGVAWINTSVVHEWGGVIYGNYPYSTNDGHSDPYEAVDLLDNAGFALGSTPNPYYDALIPWSSAFIRTYPTGWPNEGQDLDPIVACVRSDDRRRLDAGRLLYGNMRLCGIPISVDERSMAGLYTKVMGSFDYHFYTGGWSLGRYPTGIYFLYGNVGYYPFGSNYVSGYDAAGNPKYPLIDAALYDVYYTSSFAASQAACQKGLGMLQDEAMCIWLWSTKAYWAYRNLLGTVNMNGYGQDNQYSSMNMWTVDGDTPTLGLVTAPFQLNIHESSWFYDRQVLDRIYDAAGISIAPFNLAKDQPWVIQDWTPTTWVDPEDGETKSKVVVWFRQDVKWIAPVNGSVIGSFTTHDYAFSVWWALQATKNWNHDDLLDIHHIDIIDDYTVEVYMESESYWLQYTPGTYVVNKALYLNKFCMLNTTTVILPDDVTEYINKTHLGGYGAGQILQIVDVTLDAVTLDEDTDFKIAALGDDHTYFWWQMNASAGQTLVVTYWTWNPAINPGGYFPGGYSLGEIMVGIGPYYLVSDSPGAGGGAALRANRNFWLQTPPKGEVDWVWEWGARDNTRPTPNDPRGPRTGQYIIDIADVVMCTGAYGTTGMYVPSRLWKPAVDLAVPSCEIDIGDVVTITGKYGQSFGNPPSGP